MNTENEFVVEGEYTFSETTEETVVEDHPEPAAEEVVENHPEPFVVSTPYSMFDTDEDYILAEGELTPELRVYAVKNGWRVPRETSGGWETTRR